MTQPFRTAAGGRIDRQRPLRFTFDGRPHEGFAGDTLASALLANDVHHVARSFKYHRPRGVLSAGSEEPNALVTIDRGAGRVTPNLRATEVELHDGLTAISQNRFPSLRFDLGSIAGPAAPLLPPGFVYKTFMWPRSFWRRLYEPAIRRAAGLGRTPDRADGDRYLHQFAHCDVLIVGAGAAGLAAALGASATGARVILCDEQAEFGGVLLSEPAVTIDGWPAPGWVEAATGTLGAAVTLLPRTTAFGLYPGNLIGLVQRLTDHLAEPPPGIPRERLWHVRAGRIILASGATERPLVFSGNDRPGIMLAGAARTYLHRYGVKVGSRAVVVTSDDSAYRAAADMHASGISVAAVVDLRAKPDGAAVDAVRALGIPVHAGTTIGGTAGRLRVERVTLAGANERVTLAGAGTTIACDTVLMCGGWTPAVHLMAQVNPEARGQFCSAIGGCAGTFDLATCLRDGTRAGGSEPGRFEVAGFPEMAPPGLPPPAPPHPKAFVDFQNDVTSRDLATAAAEGFVSIEHVKRYTTTGMATDQGKTSNLNAAAAVAELTGQDVAAVGLTTFRPPYTPVTFGALAGPYRGDLFVPVRLPPIACPDAVPEDAGGWKRARCFPRPGETIGAAVARECLAVRNDVGIFDASTLGKIEVCGPDAALFLDRIYTGDFTGLDPGRCRYAVLAGEDGFIRDDGIVARLEADRFHVTTTTAGAAFVLHHMEDYLQTEFSGLRTWLTPVTEQWAVIAVQGPRSIEVLAPFIADIDLHAMSRMSVRQGHLGDIPVRLFRAGFTGETGFEVNLPPDAAQSVWDMLRQQDATPYGTDAMHVLRAEKGFIVIGQETDGTVTPDDLGLGWTISRTKGDFIGKRSLALPELCRADRLQLVGLLPDNAALVLEEGAQVTLAGQGSSPETSPGPSPGRSLGHVTSAYYSATLRRGFALALVAGGRSRIGARLCVAMPGRATNVTVTQPVFLPAAGQTPPTPMPSPEPVPPPKLRPQVVPPAPVTRQAAPVRTDVPASAVRTDVLAPATRMDVLAPATRMDVLGPATLLSVRAGAAAATAIGLALGVLLPTVPCRSVMARERAALWLGPDEWLIRGPDGAASLAGVARKAAGGHPASVVDVSRQFRTLQIAGPRAAWCLNGFCALDLDPRAFPVGMCTRTLLGKAGIVLWRIGPEMFTIDVARSLLPYVRACLEEARLEFADDPP